MKHRIKVPLLRQGEVSLMLMAVTRVWLVVILGDGPVSLGLVSVLTELLVLRLQSTPRTLCPGHRVRMNQGCVTGSSALTLLLSAVEDFLPVQLGSLL